MIFSWLYRQELNRSVLTGLVKGSAGFLLLYLIIKLADFTINDKWGFVFGPGVTWESYLFRVEIVLQAIVPLAVFLVPAFRNRITGLVIGTSSALVGIVLHRLNTGIVGYFRSADAIYYPNASEIMLSLGILSGAGLLFFLLVERFYIFKEPEGYGSDHHGAKVKIWSKQEALAVFAGSRAKKVALTIIVVVPATWFLFQDQATGPYKFIAQPVNAAVIGIDALRDDLRIDANLNGEGVDFPHAKHKVAISKEFKIETEATCAKCHHLNLPNDNATNCRVCHKDMEGDTPMFSKERHETRFTLAADLESFHTKDLTIKKENYEACVTCHQDNMKGLTSYADKGFSQLAPGYQHAMHGNCQTCHRQRGAEKLTDPVGEGNCLFCHKLPIAAGQNL
jgi:hypothetical protein